jgi:hypothetical protein
MGKMKTGEVGFAIVFSRKHREHLQSLSLALVMGWDQDFTG